MDSSIEAPVPESTTSRYVCYSLIYINILQFKLFSSEKPGMTVLMRQKNHTYNWSDITNEFMTSVKGK